ncbi:hypothetical protein D3C81_1999520 [compost metagenome]
MRPPRLACRDVRHMHFQCGKGHGLDGVVQRHAVLGQAGRVHQRALRRVDVLVQEVDQRALVVGLQRGQFYAQFTGQRAQALVDFRQGGGAIDVRLAAPEQVEVWAVQNKNLHDG